LALEPLQIRHLLGEARDRLARDIQRVGEDRMAGGTKLRLLQMSGLRGYRPRGRLHQRLVPRVHRIRPEHPAWPLTRARVDHEPAVEALFGAEVAALDLVAHGA